LDTITTQLEETRQAISREREKSTKMAKNILALEEELRRTKREIKELKDRSFACVNPTKLETKKGKFFDRKKRRVTFSDPIFAEILNIIVHDDVVSANRIKGKFAR
jgi:septal ring factor EnvC (AmiA/AmiB activator)